MRFTIGAGDKQALQPVMNSMIPVTRKTVAILFHELGTYVYTVWLTGGLI